MVDYAVDISSTLSLLTTLFSCLSLHPSYQHPSCQQQTHTYLLLLAFSTSPSFLPTCLGIGMMRCWFVGADGNLKSGPLLPPAKETESFIDHCWLPTMAGGLQVT